MAATANRPDKQYACGMGRDDVCRVAGGQIGNNPQGGVPSLVITSLCFESGCPTLLARACFISAIKVRCVYGALRILAQMVINGLCLNCDVLAKGPGESTQRKIQASNMLKTLLA